MAYVVTEDCVGCKFTTCVSVCPVDCFREGALMVVIDPTECIGCGVCAPECEAHAIVPDTEPAGARWASINARLALEWPPILGAVDPLPTAKDLLNQAGKFARLMGSRCNMSQTSQPECLRLAVVGAHLTGMPLNHELTSRNAQFVCRTTTAPTYRLYELCSMVPPKPGLSRCENGAAIEVEVWELPLAEVGSFVAGIPQPLGIGTIELRNGDRVHGFICEAYALTQAQDITAFGGWRHFCASQRAS